MRYLVMVFMACSLFCDDGSVDKEEVLQICQEIEAKPHFRMVRNILSQNPLERVTRNWDCIRNIDYTFSHEIGPDFSVTDQKMTGRCWMFAGLNALRFSIARKEALFDFEFSESYLFFFDKIEKANYFLEQIIEQGSEKKLPLLLRLTMDEPVSDGAFCSTFFALVKKYGLVPKSVYPESMACYNSIMLNQILKRKLLQGAHQIRTHFFRGGMVAGARSIKREVMRDIYKIMVVHMGTPPEKFNWAFYDARGEYRIQKNLTPQVFYKNYVGVDFDDYAVVFHSPRQETPYYTMFSLTDTTTVYGEKAYTFLNIPMDEMQEMVKKTIVEKKAPVIFAADVHSVDTWTGIFDTKLFEVDTLYQVDFDMDKTNRLAYNLSYPNHEMLFTGVDIHEGSAKKWKVENSWGREAGYFGYFVMTNDAFSEYVFEAVVPKSVLTPKMKVAFQKKPVVLDFLDFFTVPAKE